MPAKDKNRKQRWKVEAKLKKKRKLKRSVSANFANHPSFPPLASI